MLPMHSVSGRYILPSDTDVKPDSSKLYRQVGRTGFAWWGGNLSNEGTPCFSVICLLCETTSFPYKSRTLSTIKALYSSWTIATSIARNRNNARYTRKLKGRVMLVLWILNPIVFNNDAENQCEMAWLWKHTSAALQRPKNQPPQLRIRRPSVVNITYYTLHPIKILYTANFEACVSYVYSLCFFFVREKYPYTTTGKSFILQALRISPQNTCYHALFFQNRARHTLGSLDTSCFPQGLSRIEGEVCCWPYT